MNLVESNPREGWIDTSVTRYVCLNKELITFFEPINEEKVFIENSTFSKVKGQMKVLLKMMFTKELSLNSTLYVMKICKNMMFGSLLNKYEFCMVFESDKVFCLSLGCMLC